MNKLFGEHIYQNLFNYDNPMAEINVNGVNCRVGNGLVDWELKKKTYLLYADGKEIGKYYSLKEAENAIKL